MVQMKSKVIPASQPEDQSGLKMLVAKLGSSDAIQRHSARRQLVRMGPPAVPALIRALVDPRRQVRWEAAKALGKIADPIAANALVSALEDRDEGVRWLAAVALVALGREALPPLLCALLEHPDSEELCQGAHHVCHDLARLCRDKDAARMLAALNEYEPEIHIPPTAYDILRNMRKESAPKPLLR